MALAQHALTEQHMNSSGPHKPESSSTRSGSCARRAKKRRVKGGGGRVELPVCTFQWACGNDMLSPDTSPCKGRTRRRGVCVRCRFPSLNRVRPGIGGSFVRWLFNGTQLYVEANRL